MISKILIIEDRIESGQQIHDLILSHLRHPVNIQCVTTYEEAFALLFVCQWDLILINYQLSGRGPVETLQRVKGLIEDSHTPVIVYNTPSGKNIKLTDSMVAAGATDFLFKEDVHTDRGPKKILEHLVGKETDHQFYT